MCSYSSAHDNDIKSHCVIKINQTGSKDKQRAITNICGNQIFIA